MPALRTTLGLKIDHSHSVLFSQVARSWMPGGGDGGAGNAFQRDAVLGGA